MLKDKISDLMSKYEEAICKYYESEHRTQRAENQREDYYEIIQKKIEENKAIFEAMDPLHNQIANLTEALTNTKKEIERLNIENNNLSKKFQEKHNLLEISESKNEKLKKKCIELESENERVKQKINDQNERIEIMQLSLDRYQSKADKDYSTPSKSNQNNNGNNQNNSQGINSVNLKDQSEEILKMQLQIVDLKKKLSEDEKIRLNLFEVIKDKKAKNKSLKSELNKIVSVFEESGKENKWSQDLILQKDNIIKVLKEKISSLSNELKIINKKLTKSINKPTTEEKSIEANFPLNENLFMQVKASPNIFLNKNQKF